MKRTAQSFEKLLDRFNKPDTHLVISRWPIKGKKSDGIATYTEDIISKLSTHGSEKFVVLAEEVEGGDRYELINKNILLLRIFNPVRQTLFPRILVWLGKLSQINRVYIHSDFCASGMPKLEILKVPFLMLIRAMGRKITYYAHNVVDDLKKMNGQVFLEKDSIKLKVLDIGLKWDYRMVGLLVSRIVVLEESIKKRLEKYVGGTPILVHPHWVEKTPKCMSKKTARNRLNLPLDKKIIMSFGFISYYKGSDWLAKKTSLSSMSKIGNNCLFVLAGGPTYELDHKIYQQEAGKKYYKNIQKLANEKDNLIVTGYIEEENVRTWITACDVMVFPYKDLMGGSGALQQALKYKKSVLMSNFMLDRIDETKLKKALSNSALKINDVSFKLRGKDFEKVVDRIENDAKYLKSLESFGESLADEYSFESLFIQHLKEVYRDWRIDVVKNKVSRIVKPAYRWIKK